MASSFATTTSFLVPPISLPASSTCRMTKASTCFFGASTGTKRSANAPAMRAPLSKGSRLPIRHSRAPFPLQTSCVTVDTVDAAGERRALQSRAAILTLPIGVLRHPAAENDVTFEPQLPSSTRAAIGRIEMGHVVKVVMSFKTPFWERIDAARYRDAGFFYIENEAIATYWTQVPVRSELLVAWAGGPRATALRACNAAERI
jgi:hypothetical protein